jgi:hypothetical protein
MSIQIQFFKPKLANILENIKSNQFNNPALSKGDWSNNGDGTVTKNF